MFRFLSLCMAFFLTVTQADADVSMNPQSAPKGTYKLEPSHSSVLFCIRHMEISDYCGRFDTITGKLVFNGAQPGISSSTVEITVASIDTPSAALNDKLRNEFFEVTKFPKASFTAKSVKVTGKNEGEVTGDLTLHGVTRPVTLKTTFNGGLVHPFANAYAIGFSAMATIRIADFNFPDVAWKIFVADEVKLYIETEFVADK